MPNKIQLEDQSEDRKYFTIIPNYVLNHSTATAQALYMQLKRLGGECGVAYPGYRYLMSKLGVNYYTIKKELAYLVDKGWIEYLGEQEIPTRGGTQKTKAYRIVDLWKLNATYYEKEYQKRNTLPQRGIKIETPNVSQTHQRGVKIETKEDIYNKKLIERGENKFSPSRRFAPPSVEEVKSYCTERSNQVDAQTFVDFYECKGWFVGKNKMKDWRAAVRTWERRRFGIVGGKSELEQFIIP